MTKEALTAIKAEPTDAILEAAVTAALNADILPIEGMDGVRINNFLNYKPADAVELGVKIGNGEDGKPRWHYHSDIRSDEYDDCNRAILRPVIKAALLSAALTSTVEKVETPVKEKAK